MPYPVRLGCPLASDLALIELVLVKNLTNAEIPLFN